MKPFIHLHTHSHYSLLDGLAKIEGLVNRAKELGMPSLALTDHGNLYGAIEFYKTAKKASVKPILGVETYVAPNKHTDKRAKIDNQNYHLILLAENKTGWQNIIHLVTKSYLDGFYYKPRVDHDLLREYHEGIIALSACAAGEIGQAIISNQYQEAKKIALEYEHIFGKGNYFLETQYHPNIPDCEKINKEIFKLSKETGIEVVATQDIHYLKPEDADVHDVLLAVQTGNTINDPDRLTLKMDDFSMRSPEEMNEFYKDTPEVLENTAKIAERCNVELELNKIMLPKFPLPENKTANDFLNDLIKERLPKRYSPLTDDVKKRLDFELSVIEKTGFTDYFLIVQDFVNWAKERGIVVGPGRGSAAGSIVSYILGITDLDPIKYNLLFERFLNPERISMPDIDLDFTDVRRDEVFGYLKEKYGENRTAHIITFGTMAARAAIRDAGRAMGIPLSFCDQIAKLIPFNNDIDEAIAGTSELKTLYDNEPDAKKLMDIAKKLEGVARHASVHACGTVISQEPLTNYLPLQRSPQDPNAVITQFEMHSIEDIGLLKMDLLGLKNLTIIENALRLIEESTGERINISDIPLDDKKVFKILQDADTTGIFQLESSGMRRYLKELKPSEMEDIIAMVALYRPGPMELIPTYIKRKFGKEPVVYLHPSLEPILKNTYGIMIYQEQLMNGARALSGITLSEADILRKAIGKKIAKLLQEQKSKIIDGAIKNGVKKEIAEQFWSLIEPFDKYGFNRSHAACYAMIAYRTAYLRAHYPVEFYTSLFNSDSGDIERIAFLIAEAKKAGFAVLPPDINKSLATFAPEEKSVRFGLLAIKNLGQNIVDAVVSERQRGGPFKNITDLLERVEHKDLNKKSLEALLKCGALDSLEIERNAGLLNIEDILKFSSNLKRSKQTNQNSLFGAHSGTSSLNSLRLKTVQEASPKERLAWEKELLGLYISDHPLNSYKDKIAEQQKKHEINDIKYLNTTNGDLSPIKRYKIVGMVAKIHKIVTKMGQPMAFVVIEDFTDNLEIIVFSDVMEKTQSLWQEGKIALISGRMSFRNNELKMICEKAVEL
ncbi:MAG: DNA polymerase III subunit alpha [Candidatus Pacebacteria bacterium]|nr:DNA polymerase III subunit alpha [Candidatus Paceibacterota bacterium]